MANAFHTRPGPLRRCWRQGQVLLADYGGPLLTVTVLASDLLRIRLARSGSLALRRSWAVARPDEEYPPASFAVDDTTTEISITTEHLVVLLARDGGRVSIHERDSGRTVLEDGPDGGPAWDAPAGRAIWAKRMPANEHYYGFGERTGLLDKRGRRYTCWATDEYEHQGPSTDALYQAIPFLLALDDSGRSYGLFLNNTYRSVFDMSDTERGRFQLEVADGELDYYLIYGPQPARVIERYTEITGRMPLPPRWALGYHQSRWSYDSASCVRDLAAQFRERGIPADTINLDIDYMDGYRVFTWDSARFPDPARLTRDLGQQGFKVTAIVDTGVKDVGIAGFVNDMNEPAMHDKPFDHPESHSAEPPPETPHGPEHEPTTHAEARNVYAYLEDQATYQALRQLRPNQRPFLLSRAGFAGVQRYAAVWAGDNTSFWEHLEMSLPQLLNMGLSGIAFCGTDIGGFFENGSPELYARWMQLGSLYPFAHSNSAKGTSHNAPWAWSERVEAICRRALELRYRLLPYLYTLFEEAARTGAPVLRPLFYHDPSDRATHQLHDQALLGRDQQIAPVLRPGKICREVYLPRGLWYDTRSGERLSGPRHILADAPLDMPMPVYARGGAIIPSGPPMQWCDERSADPLTLDVYLDEQGSAQGSLYEDDGRSFDYETGQICRRSYDCETDQQRGVSRIRARRQGNYAPAG